MAVPWRRPGFLELGFGRATYPLSSSVPQSLRLCPVGMAASVPPGSIRARHGGDVLPMALHGLWVLLLPLSWCWVRRPWGVRVTHSGQSCLSVSEGQGIYLLLSRKRIHGHSHRPSFCSLAEEIATLATGSISGRFPLLAPSHSLLFSFQWTSFV